MPATAWAGLLLHTDLSNLAKADAHGIVQHQVTVEDEVSCIRHPWGIWPARADRAPGAPRARPPAGPGSVEIAQHGQFQAFLVLAFFLAAGLSAAGFFAGGVFATDLLPKARATSAARAR